MNAALIQKLLDMQKIDLSVRDRLAADKTLYDGYHPEMQAVHEKNADALAEIIKTHGWPDTDLVGEKASEAAWLIAQHAISRPDFQRECLHHLQIAADQGKAPPWQPAYMIDRIRSFEGRPQVYGTQFDWDENGALNPNPIEDEKNVDRRRAAVGLPLLDQAIKKMRADTAGEPRPQDWQERKKQADQWARRMGWRK